MQIKTSPVFFLAAMLIGLNHSYTGVSLLVWVGVLFLSMLFHELGHALTARMFQQQSRIKISAWGGWTLLEGSNISFWQEVVVIFMGPVYSLVLFIAASVALQSSYGTPFLREIFAEFRYINLFWIIMNLLPIQSLDGGRLLRVFLEAVWGPKSHQVALYISALFAAACSLIFLLIGTFAIGALFCVFFLQTIFTLRSLENEASCGKSA